MAYLRVRQRAEAAMMDALKWHMEYSGRHSSIRYLARVCCLESTCTSHREEQDTIIATSIRIAYHVSVISNLL